MSMNKKEYFSIKFNNDKLIFLDQTKIPFEENYVETNNYERIAEAIEKLEMRGAPLIGIAAAYGLSLAFKNSDHQKVEEIFEKAYQRLHRTRPTAVNLFFALDEIKNVFTKNKNSENLYSILLERAKHLHSEDAEKCRKIGENGLRIFKRNLKYLHTAIPANLQPVEMGRHLMLLKWVLKIILLSMFMLMRRDRCYRVQD